MERVWVLIAVSVIAVVASSGCGVSTSSDATTSSGVPLPTGTQPTRQELKKFIGRYYRELLAAGVKVSVARCYERHVEKLSQTFLTEILAETVSPQRQARFNRGLEATCVPAGTSAAQENRSTAQIEKLRDLLQVAAVRRLEEEGVPLVRIECTEDEIEALSISEVELMTSNKPKGQEIGNSIYTRCKEAE
jgi:hypothetical protein